MPTGHKVSTRLRPREDSANQAASPPAPPPVPLPASSAARSASSPAPATNPGLPWQEEAISGWGSLDASIDDDGITLNGTCPKCLELTAQDISLTVANPGAGGGQAPSAAPISIRTTLGGGVQIRIPVLEAFGAWVRSILSGKRVQTELPPRVVAICHCSTAHPQTPQGKDGCGRFGFFDLTTTSLTMAITPKGAPDPTVKPTLQDKRWQERADDLVVQGLPQVRATATLWTATIGALTGLFGLGLVIKSRSDLALLSAGTARWVGLFSLLAVLAAASAIWQGAVAAQGTPARIWGSGDSLKRWYRTQAPDADIRLKRSRVLTVIGLVFLILSVGFYWYGTGSTKANAAYLLVVTRHSGVFCGTTTNSPGFLVVTSPNSQSQSSVPFSDLASVTAVQACP